MAHTVLWPKKTFFYPIGNTAPISFSQTLPPEIPANALLLGCGDPRSILYTVYSDLQNRIPIHPLHSLELLQIQCRKLISLSSTLETWENGQYSTTIRFCSRYTLTELHRYWGMYLETPDLVHKDQEDLRTAFKKGMQAARDKLGGDVVLTSGASAGPLWASVIPSGSTHFQQFWIKGVTHSDDETSDATLVNPAFAYDSTGRGFNVHYGTDPLISFHLAMVAQLPASNHPASISDLVQLAKTQFRSWCSAFRDRITTAKNVVIRMFVGDALAFSQTLLYCTRTGSIHSGAYVSPWVGVQASLDGGDYDTVSTNRAPLSFNVIDTSNLTDSMGLLNVLIMAVPLLERSTAAVLNTNTLLTSEDGGGSPGGLTYRACADISTLSLLLGIVPVSYVSGFTSQSNTHEATGISPGKERCHEPLSWRFAPVLGKVEADNLPRALQIEAPLLGQILFNIYLRMFSDEILTAALKQGAFVHYVRTSFAALLALVRQNVQTAWKQAMDHMIDCVEADRVLFTGANHYQDLCCQLHLHGVYTVDTLNERNSPAPGAGPFKLWKHVPPVVCVVLKVPRQSLRVLEDVNPDQVGTPIMQCEVIGPGVQNSFSSIQCFFGETLSGAAVHDLLIQEDADRWMGDSALIASFYVPSWILNFQPASTQIRFSIRGGAACNPMLYSVLGMPPNIFSARLLDNTHVRVVATRPDNAQELKRLYSDFSSNLDPQTKPEATLESQNHVSVIVDQKSHNALGLTCRVSFHNPNDQKTLRECDASKAKIKQVSPCSMMLSLSTLNKLLTFPYPINGSNYKSRIAKKSSYIEVMNGPRQSY
ncbi:hypothetical protein H0H81_001127 [Sphagnurus paluster]|uniref:DUF4470 domain-containing protein n=1 Tax=Sphagnurus paluster TaxID=117069 RepID=A0A9P7FTR2_9AGAR|nr:hypothetical protein H0H81_001127 [Sphagnurus paluster]